MSNPQLVDFLTLVELPAFRNPGYVHQKYVTEGLSVGQIALQCRVSKEAIRKAVKDSGIGLRRPHKHHGHPSQPRYGERISQGKAVPHMAEMRVVRAVADMHKDGLTLRQIAAYLDKIGVPTKNRGKKWHPEMVNRILNQVPQQPSIQHADILSASS